ncbi:hypothetical protein Tco_0007061 [Tanacetum coccineum]
MDDWGADSCVGQFSVKMLVAGHSGAGKGGSRVLIPDLVVMARVGALGSGLLLEHEVGKYRRSDRILEGKDHRRCLLWTSIPARMGYFAHIHRLHKVLCSNRKSGKVSPTSRVGVSRKEICLQALFKRPLSVGCIASEMEETFMEGDGSSHISSWYWIYSSIRIHPSSSVREWKRN